MLPAELRGFYFVTEILPQCEWAFKTIYRLDADVNPIFDLAK